MAKKKQSRSPSWFGREASQDADLDFLVGASGAEVPKDSH